MPQFKDLQIGDTFDFISGDLMRDTFYATCQKMSARTYRWMNPHQCSLSPDKYLKTRVGSGKVEVYHVNESAMLA